MKKLPCIKAFAAFTIFAVSLGASQSPAKASTSDAANTNMVREAQQDLADLGYYSGSQDGLMGWETRLAIKGFQRHNSLKASGKLNPTTYSLLVSKDYKQRNGVGISHPEPEATAGNDEKKDDWQKMGDAHIPLKASGKLNPTTYSLLVSKDYKQRNGVGISHPEPEATVGNDEKKDDWQKIGDAHIPLTVGTMVVHEDVIDGKRHYTFSVNNQELYHVDDQPGELRMSKVFNLKNEDAFVVTSYRGDSSCAYSNILITIGDYGTSVMKREIESCASANSVHRANNAIFVNFSAAMDKDGFAAWDVWRYEDTRLVRL